MEDGGAEGFNEFFEENYRRMVSSLIKTGVPWQDAEDAVNDAMIEVLIRWRDVADPVAYAFTAAYRKARSAMKRQKRANRSVLEARKEIATDPIQLKEDELVLVAALRQLPLKQRSVIGFELAGLDTATIAQILGMSVATVRSNRRHGIKALHRIMTESFTPPVAKGGVLDAEYS